MQRFSLTLPDRLAALLDHLGLGRAHFATQMPGDLAAFAEQHAGRIASIAFTVPVRLDPAPFAAVAARTLIVTGSSGVSAVASERAAARLAGARLVRLDGYATTGWSDVARDRTGELADALLSHMAACEPQGPRVSGLRQDAARQGTHAGIGFRIEGRGPALILLPFFLAPSQWDPVVPALAQAATVIRIGGAHVGGVAILEDRAARPSYQAMFRTLVDLMAPPAGARVLEVGCGSGALARLLAHRLGPGAQIEAVDLNAFMLAEARHLAGGEGLGERIRFSTGSAVALPCPSGAFDCAYSVTVLEECDADAAIAELVRVVKPGGRVGLIVRAIDLPQHWNLDMPEVVRARAAEPPQSVAAGGVADRSLYARMLRAGLVDLVPFPSLVTLDRPGSTVWRYREDHLLGLLDPGELAQWERAREDAAAAGLLFQAHPMHCAVARKPAEEADLIPAAGRRSGRPSSA
jgi:ubiquinone/menaquinone biosynthesis C-methylase UbiE